jgi:hypothetical protein
MPSSPLVFLGLILVELHDAVDACERRVQSIPVRLIPHRQARNSAVMVLVDEVIHPGHSVRLGDFDEVELIGYDVGPRKRRAQYEYGVPRHGHAYLLETINFQRGVSASGQDGHLARPAETRVWIAPSGASQFTTFHPKGQSVMRRSLAIARRHDAQDGVGNEGLVG